MANPDALLKEGFELRRRIDSGAANEADLNDRGQVMLAIVRRQRKLQDLNPAGKRLLGLDPTLRERVGELVTRFQRGAGERPAEPPGIPEFLGRAVSMGGEAGLRALTDPEGAPLATKLKRPGVSLLRQPAVLPVEAAERGLNAVFGALNEFVAGLGTGATERALRDVTPPLLFGRQAFGGRPAPTTRAGLAEQAIRRAPTPPFVPAEVRPEARPTVMGQPASGEAPIPSFVWDPVSQTFRPSAMRAPRALPPGPPIPDFLFRRRGLGRELPPGPREPLALPPARAVRGEQLGLPRGEPLSGVERVEAGVGAEGGEPRAGAAPVSEPPTPPAPTGERSTTFPPTPPGRPAPATFAGMQEAPGRAPFELFTLTEDIPGHPQGSTVSRGTLERAGFRVPTAPLPQRVPLPSSGSLTRGLSKEPIDRNTVNLDDPAQVRQIVRQEGGIRTGSMGGEREGIPFGFFRRQGTAFDEIVDVIAKAQGRSSTEVEAKLIRGLRGIESRAAFQAGEELRETPPADVPIPVRQWRMMDRLERQESIAIARGTRDPSSPESGAARTGLLPPLALGAAAAAGGAAAGSLLARRPDQPPVQEDEPPPRLPGTLMNIPAPPAGVRPVPLPPPGQDLGDRPMFLPEGPDMAQAPPPPGQNRLRSVLETVGQALPLVAMLAGRGRAGRPGEPPARPLEAARRAPEAARRPPEVPPEFRRESVRPAPPSERRTPGVPPPETPVGPTAPVEPSPYKGVPYEHLDGRSYWRQIKEMPRAVAATFKGRWEAMGPPGQEISRLYSLVHQQSDAWYGQHVQPLVRELGGLSKPEKANFWEVLETPGASPVSDKVQTALRAWDGLFGTPDRPGVIPTEAQKRNILVRVFEGPDPQRPPGSLGRRPFQPRFGPTGHFAPHEFHPEYVRQVLRPNSRIRQQAIRSLMDREGVDADTAGLMLDDQFGGKFTRVGGRLVSLSPERIVGGLERAREVNLDTYLRDPEVVAAIRGSKVARRLAELDHYGPLDGVIGHPGGALESGTNQSLPPRGLIGDIHRTRGRQDAETALTLFRYAVGGKSPAEVQFGRLSRLATGVETFTKLPLAFLLHIPQSGLLSFRTSFGSMMQGWARTLAHPRMSAETVREMGIAARDTMRDIYESMGATAPEGGSGGARAGQLALRFATKPWNLLFRFNEMVTANAGRAWGNRLNRLLGASRSPRDTAFLERELTRLNFSKPEITQAMEQGRLGPESLNRVAWEIVDQTMFISGAGRRTEFMQHPLGRALSQFKFWGINAGRLIHQMAWQEGVLNRNPSVLAQMALVWPLMGELTNDLRALARGTERDNDPFTPTGFTKRFFEDFFVVGGFGLVTEATEAFTRSGERGMFNFISGPTISDAIKIGNLAHRAIGAAVNQNPDELERTLRESGRFVTRQIPFVGPILSQQMREDPRAERRARLTWDQRLGLDPEHARIRRLERLDRQAGRAVRAADQRAASGDVEGARESLERFNRAHGTFLRLSPSGIRAQQRRSQPEAPPRLRRGVPVGAEADVR